jgi:hypothetical protein
MSTNEERQAEHARQLAAMSLEDRAVVLGREWQVTKEFALEFLKLSARVAVVESK